MNSALPIFVNSGRQESSLHLSRKAEGDGPEKPWQPADAYGLQGAKSIPVFIHMGKDKSDQATIHLNNKAHLVSGWAFYL